MAALLLLVFLLLPRPAFAHETSEFTIQMRDEGFFPAYLETKQGDSVTFKNEGKNPHWPASDIHPTHQAYPELDPQKAILPGKTWSFTFKKAGEWGLHDHLYPEFSARILVEEDQDFIDTEKPEAKREERLGFRERIKFAFTRFYFRLFPFRLKDMLEKTNMLEVARDASRLHYWLRVLGPKKFMEELLADSGGGALADCHQEAHQAGRVAYELFGAQVFADGDSSCHSGFYHGAMEALLAERGTQNLSKIIKNVCGIFETGFGNFECLHGVGHGVMAYEDYDLPRSLDVCRQLQSEFDQGSCYGGVFMENIITARGLGARPGHETEWVSEDPHFPCNILERDFVRQRECYMMQTSWMLNLAGFDFSSVAKECLNAPQDMRPICFQSLGRDAAGHTLRDTSEIVEICKEAPARYFDACIQGALNVIVDFWGERLSGQPQELCKILPANSKDFCYSLLGLRLIDIFGQNAQRIRQECELAESPYKYTCLAAAGVN